MKLLAELIALYLIGNVVIALIFIHDDLKEKEDEAKHR